MNIMKLVSVVATLVVVIGSLVLAIVYKDTITELWSVLQQDTVTVFVGGNSFSVTVADTPEERRQGLSGTDPLPEFAGKLFIFDTADQHGIWMKDMNYALDIMWFNTERQLIHIEKDVAPDTYTQNRTIFRPDQPARYVLEVRSGTVETLGITTADTLNLPPQLLAD